MLEEMAKHLAIRETLEKHLFVVSGDAVHASALSPFARRFDHPCAFRTTVDQIAQQDHRTVGGSRCGVIPLDSLDQLVQQVTASMYVANDVIAFAVGDARTTCALATPTKKLRKIEHGT